MHVPFMAHEWHMNACARVLSFLEMEQRIERIRRNWKKQSGSISKCVHGTSVLNRQARAPKFLTESSDISASETA